MLRLDSKLYYHYYRWKYSLLSNKLTNIITLTSFVFAIILAFWPGLFSLEGHCINKTFYEEIRPKLTKTSVAFIEQYIRKDHFNVKQFLKSIPKDIPDSDRVYIVDLISNYTNYQSINHLLTLIFLFIILIAFAIRELISGRKYRIAHSLAHLHLAIHVIRDNWHEIFPRKNNRLTIDKEKAKKYIQKSLDEFERYISVVTGAPCRACIKVIVDPESLRVETFIRSSFCEKVPTNPDKPEDRIYNNTDYKALFEKKNRYWYVKNVDTDPNYQNSHLDITSNQKKSAQLGYASTFTWPIRKLNFKGELEIYGFLCIDSRVAAVFDERYDFDSGALLADFYYFLLRAYNKISAEDIKEEVKNEGCKCRAE